MIIILNDCWGNEIKAFLNKEEQDEFRNLYHYSTGKGKLKVDISKWSDASIESLRKFLQDKADDGDRSAQMSATNVEKFQRIKIDPTGETVGKLEQLKTPMTFYIGRSDHRYVFHQEDDGNLVPWFVTHISYYDHEPRSGTPARVEIGLAALNTSNNNRSGYGTEELVIHTEDIRKKTMAQILAAKKYYLETPELMKQYEREVETYLKHCDEDGFQMSVSGKCRVIGGNWYSNRWRTVEQSGRTARMVIDPPERERSTPNIHAKFWNADEEVLWTLPIHPVFEMFDLGEHEDFRVHVNNAIPYQYDDTVDTKLVLEDDLKAFLTVLIEHSKNHFKDIIGGKEGGTIVLIGGVPGVGKTLSAEVYSEKMHRPLYKVQSSQLGTDPVTVEKQLKEVLERSERWGAILLIDEADVYVRARGTDIHQNAIVGVFLRVLEYYRGVLFMTTNLESTVDDAIISRTTARFEFKMPDKESQKKIWLIMSEQNDLGMSESEINQIVKIMPELSGRDIKNLIKLAVVYSASTGDRVSPKTIKFVSRFKQSGSAKVVEG